ncbi:hypothetical protein T06_8955 [Trichinella sp. T6]|nr:hypothetical protein T06_8955 [Trichinella sp. T6]
MVTPAGIGIGIVDIALDRGHWRAFGSLVVVSMVVDVERRDAVGGSVVQFADRALSTSTGNAPAEAASYIFVQQRIEEKIQRERGRMHEQQEAGDAEQILVAPHVDHAETDRDDVRDQCGDDDHSHAFGDHLFPFQLTGDRVQHHGDDENEQQRTDEHFAVKQGEHLAPVAVRAHFPLGQVDGADQHCQDAVVDQCHREHNTYENLHVAYGEFFVPLKRSHCKEAVQGDDENEGRAGAVAYLVADQMQALNQALPSVDFVHADRSDDHLTGCGNDCRHRADHHRTAQS